MANRAEWFPLPLRMLWEFLCDDARSVRSSRGACRHARKKQGAFRRISRTAGAANLARRKERRRSRRLVVVHTRDARVAGQGRQVSTRLPFLLLLLSANALVAPGPAVRQCSGCCGDSEDLPAQSFP